MLATCLVLLLLLLLLLLSLLPTCQVIDFTMGYVMDRRLGDTGSLGGAFGLLYAIGCPFTYPEGHPWQSSWQQTVSSSHSGSSSSASGIPVCVFLSASVFIEPPRTGEHVGRSPS
jgi:hypothetical protein